MRPARTSEDLPLPEVPTTARKRECARRSSSSSNLIVATEVQGRFVRLEGTQPREGIVGPVHRQRRARLRSSRNGAMGSGAKGPNWAITVASWVL